VLDGDERDSEFLLGGKWRGWSGFDVLGGHDIAGGGDMWDIKQEDQLRVALYFPREGYN
jgi:hypothetical protein